MVDVTQQAEVLEARIEKVGGYATAMVDRYLAARQKLAIFEGLIADDVARMFEDSYGVHAYVTLRLTLVLDLIRDAWAFALDLHERSPSVANVWRLIENDELRTALRDIATKARKSETVFGGEGWTEEEKARWSSHWDEEDKEQAAKAFDETFARTKVAVANLRGSDLATMLGRTRKKSIAHYDMVVRKDGPKPHRPADVELKWGDAKVFLNELDPIVWDIALLATWGGYAKEEFERTACLYATDFWARLRGKAPVENLG